MTCCGKFTFVCCFLFAAAATCSFFFPLLRAAEDDAEKCIYQYYGEEKIPLWRVLDLLGTNPYASEKDAEAHHVHSFVRTDLWQTQCKPAKIMFIVSTITATVGTAFSGISVIVLSVFCCKMKPPKVRRVIRVASFFSPLAFILLAVSVAVLVVMYTSNICSDDQHRFLSLKSSGYHLVEGFGLLCAGTGGMFLVSLFECCV